MLVSAHKWEQKASEIQHDRRVQNQALKTSAAHMGVYQLRRHGAGVLDETQSITLSRRGLETGFCRRDGKFWVESYCCRFWAERVSPPLTIASRKPVDGLELEFAFYTQPSNTPADT